MFHGLAVFFFLHQLYEWWRSDQINGSNAIMCIACIVYCIKKEYELDPRHNNKCIIFKLFLFCLFATRRPKKWDIFLMAHLSLFASFHSFSHWTLWCKFSVWHGADLFFGSERCFLSSRFCIHARYTNMEWMNKWMNGKHSLSQNAHHSYYCCCCCHFSALKSHLFCRRNDEFVSKVNRF